VKLVRPKTGTVALFVDLERDHARATAIATASALRELGFSVALCDDQGRVLDVATPGASVEEAILLVTIGGDGTLLRAAKIALLHGIPLCGINTGRLGFLTEIEGDKLDALIAMLRDGFVIDERTALEARHAGTSHLALNEVVVRRTGSARLTPFGIFVDGQEAAHVPADGILIATPTGSTGYSLSAGGPIMTPDLAGIGIVALLPHTLFSRPLVVPSTSTIEITCDGEITHANLEADGRIIGELTAGARITIARYARTVRFARRKPLAFFALLEEKLRWNAPIKDRSPQEPPEA
jgi:NAD+ kinase